jgi:hypothetical protein
VGPLVALVVQSHAFIRNPTCIEALSSHLPQPRRVMSHAGGHAQSMNELHELLYAEAPKPQRGGG